MGGWTVSRPIRRGWVGWARSRPRCGGWARWWAGRLPISISALPLAGGRNTSGQDRRGCYVAGRQAPGYCRLVDALGAGAGASDGGMDCEPPDQARLGRLGEEQAALRRVGTLVGRATSDLDLCVAARGWQEHEWPGPAGLLRCRPPGTGLLSPCGRARGWRRCLRWGDGL